MHDDNVSSAAPATTTTATTTTIYYIVVGLHYCHTHRRCVHAMCRGTITFATIRIRECRGNSKNYKKVSKTLSSMETGTAAATTIQHPPQQLCIRHDNVG
eukprot:scaffold2974_cov181-Amphora_coffeaeformis.AAC.7